MYRCYNIDDDSDLLHTRGQDLKNRLRHAVQSAAKIQDPAAREAVSELVEAFRVISEILYDVCPAPDRQLVALDLSEMRRNLN